MLRDDVEELFEEAQHLGLRKLRPPMRLWQPPRKPAEGILKSFYALVWTAKGYRPPGLHQGPITPHAVVIVECPRCKGPRELREGCSHPIVCACQRLRGVKQ